MNNELIEQRARLLQAKTEFDSVAASFMGKRRGFVSLRVPKISWQGWVEMRATGTVYT